LLYCNDHLYDFDLLDGVGVVALDQDDYGQATLRIFSSDFSPTEITKTVTIEQPSTDDIRLLAPSAGIINKEVGVVLRFNRKPLPDFEVKATNPNGKESYLITDEDGKIFVMLDVAGIWSFKASVYGKEINAMTNAAYEVLSISLTDTPSIGIKTIINTEPYASIEIFLEEKLIEQYTASPQGIVEFTPTVGGFYEVRGTSNNKKGTRYFDVIGNTNIRILDALTASPVIGFEKGKLYQIIVSNNAGVALDNIETLYITTPFATTEILSLKDGGAIWTPHLTGSYIFTIEDMDTQAGTSRHIKVNEVSVEENGMVIPIIIFIVIMVIFITIIVIYSHYKHVPLRGIFKIFKFSKKKTKLPFDFD